MHSLLSHHLFRQLPYEVRWDSQAIYNSVEIRVNDEWIKADPWAHHPASLINVANDEENEHPAELILEENNIQIPRSANFPTRQPIMTEFVSLFVKYGNALPDVAVRGVFNDLPSSLLPSLQHINVIRPEHSSEWHA